MCGARRLGVWKKWEEDEVEEEEGGGGWRTGMLDSVFERVLLACLDAGGGGRIRGLGLVSRVVELLSFFWSAAAADWRTRSRRARRRCWCGVTRRGLG